MHISGLFAVATFGVAASLAAQGGSFTSPAGYDTTDGSSNHDYILFSEYGMRWQQIDHTHRGTPQPNINAISWRRDAATVSDATWISRNVTNLRVIMAHVDPVSFAPSATNMSGTYKDVPVTVVTVPMLNLPDWTTQTAVPPAAEPFTITVPFTTGWNYNGTDDFVWEVQYDTNDQAANDYGNDFVLDTGSSTGYNSTTGSILTGSVGCIATGDNSGFDITGTFYNYGTKFRVTFGATDAPPNAGILLFLGLSDINLALPGLCGPIRTDSVLLQGTVIGAASATGTMSTVNIDNLPYSPVVVGLDFYGQHLALDVGQTGLPLVVSNGRKWTMPMDPQPHNCTRLYNYLISSTSTTWTTSGPWYGGIVARFDHP